MVHDVRKHLGRDMATDEGIQVAVPVEGAVDEFASFGKVSFQVHEGGRRVKAKRGREKRKSEAKRKFVSG